MVPRFIATILNGNQPVIYGDGLQSRDFTYVANVVHDNLLAADSPGVSGMVFNVACGRATTLLDLLDAINRGLGTNVKPQFAAPRPGDIRESLADITMARKMLGYEPQIGLLEGIEKWIQHYRTMAGIPVPNGD